MPRAKDFINSIDEKNDDFRSFDEQFFSARGRLYKNFAKMLRSENDNKALVKHYLTELDHDISVLLKYLGSPNDMKAEILGFLDKQSK